MPHETGGAAAPVQLERGKSYAIAARVTDAVRYRWWFYRHSYVGGPDYVTPPQGTVNGRAGMLRRQVIRNTDAGPSVGYQEIGGGTYLVPHEREDEDDFRLRLEQAWLLNFCEPIVERFVSMVFSKPIERELPPVLQERFGDFDGLGHDIDQAMRHAARWALVYGCLYNGTDRPREQYQNAGDQLAAPLWSRICEPQHMLAWQRGADGTTMGAIVYEGHAPSPDGLLTAPQKADDAKPRYMARYWTPGRWYLLEVCEDVARVVDDGETFPFVPFAPVIFRPLHARDETMGRPLIQDVADAQCEIFNELSLLRDLHRQQGAPMLMVPGVVTGGRVNTAEEITWSTRRYHQYKSDAGVPTWSSPPVEHAVEKRVHVEWLAQRIMEMVGLAKRGKDTAQVQSGESLRWENLEAHQLAHSLAETLENAEREIHAIRAAALLGGVPRDYRDEISVKYSREYAPPAPLEIVEELAAYLALSLGGKSDLAAIESFQRRYFGGLDPGRVAEIVEGTREEREREAETTKALDAEIVRRANEPPRQGAPMPPGMAMKPGGAFARMDTEAQA